MVIISVSRCWYTEALCIMKHPEILVRISVEQTLTPFRVAGGVRRGLEVDISGSQGEKVGREMRHCSRMSSYFPSCFLIIQILDTWVTLRPSPL